MMARTDGEYLYRAVINLDEDGRYFFNLQEKPVNAGEGIPWSGHAISRNHMGIKTRPRARRLARKAIKHYIAYVKSKPEYVA